MEATPAATGGETLIDRVIAASSRNPFLVIILTVFGMAAASMACGIRHWMPFPISVTCR